MLHKMAGMLKEQKPVTRSRLTQTNRVKSADSHTQTQGLISTLLASFAVDTSPPSAPVQERSSEDSDTDSSPDISCSSSSNTEEVSRQGQPSGVDPGCQREGSNLNSRKDRSYGPSMEVLVNTGHNVSDILDGECSSESTNGFASNPHHSRDPSNSGVTQNTVSTSSHASKYAELKTQFESPDHLAKIKSSSTEVTASFIRNSIDNLRHSLSLNKNSPSKLEQSPSNLNSLSSSNGHSEPSLDSENTNILDKYKPADDIRNEPAV